MNNPLRMHAEILNPEEETSLESPPEMTDFVVTIMIMAIGIFTTLYSGWVVWFIIHHNVTHTLGLGTFEKILNTGILGFICGIMAAFFAASRASDIRAVWRAQRMKDKAFIQKMLDDYTQRDNMHPRMHERITRIENEKYKNM